MWPDKKLAIDEADSAMEFSLVNLHPTDKAEAYREIESRARFAAEKQEGMNDAKGVPEKDSDR